MLYLYDQCLVDDLRKSFNTEGSDSPVVQVIDPEGVIDLAAQIQDDNITFPIVAVVRDENTPIDTDRTNFTHLHRGISTVLDPETNLLYYEKVVPIKLSYKLTVITTNTVDMDELTKELIFKYLHMYFLTMELPYECKRKVRFGLTVDPDGIERKSGTFEYLKNGQLYQTILPLTVEGAVLVSYTPCKVQQLQTETHIVDPSGREPRECGLIHNEDTK